MKKQLAFLASLLLSCLSAFAQTQNITNYPTVTQVSPGDWIFVSAYGPSMRTRNIALTNLLRSMTNTTEWLSLAEELSGTRFVDVTNGSDTIKHPYQTINAANADAQPGETIVIRKGLYETGSLRLTNVIYHLDMDAHLTAGDCIQSVGRTVITIRGNGILHGEFVMTNGIVDAECDVWAMNLGSSVVWGTTNHFNVRAKVVICGWGVQATNVIASVDADQIFALGTIRSTNSFVTARCNYADDRDGFATFMEVANGATAQVVANVASIDTLQSSPDTGGNFFLTASTFHVNFNERQFITGGFTPDVLLNRGDINGYITNIQFGSWTVVTNMPIPPRPKTRYDSLIGS